MDIEKLKYPVGKFHPASDITMMDVQSWINDIERLPVLLNQAVANLSDDMLDTPYRPEGWTLRQVVHHIADSHMNAYIRFKLAVTEFNPIIKPYDEVKWAECSEAKHAPVELSLRLIEAMHERLVVFLSGLGAEDWEKEFIHPEKEKYYSLKFTAGLYAWHGRHHLAHITETVKTEGW